MKSKKKQTMNLTIDPSKLTGLNAIVTRLNSAENAEQITAEEYLTDRVNELLESYTAQEIERVKAENADFFNLAATLSADKQEQIKALVQQLAST
jgi:molecular chaperone GrpE (heat shock protein)